MSTDNVQIVLTARDNASQQVNAVSNSLLGVTKNARLLKRETYGVGRFAAALDVVAGTKFGGLINQFTTIGYALSPFQDKIESVLGSLTTKIGALSVPFTAEGTTLGTVLGGSTVTAVSAVLIPGLVAVAAIAGPILAAMLVAKANAPSNIDLSTRNSATIVWERYGRQLGNAAGTALGQGIVTAVQSPDTADVAAAGRTKAAAKAAASSLSNAWLTEMTSTETARAAWRAANIFPGQFLKVISDQSVAAAQSAKHFADTFSTDLVSALKGNKKLVASATHDMLWALNHPQALEHQLARVQKALNSTALGDLLSSTNPMQRAIGEQIRARLTGQFEALTGTTYQQGVTSIVNAIDSLRLSLKMNVTVPANTIFNIPHQAPQYATGGYLGPYQTGRVNERGNEYITAGRHGATITPPSGGHGHNIYLNGRLVGQAVDAYLGRQMSIATSGVVNRG